MYRAIEDIGGYKEGDIVPDEKALIWEKMYLESPVEKVGDSEELDSEGTTEDSQGEVSEEPEEDSEGESSSLLDDYLERNARTVVKNVKEDDLSEEQLEELLELEEAGKDRVSVVKAIKSRLEE